MLYIGLDVHSKWMTVMGFDPETGEIISEERVPNELEALQATFEGLKGPIYGVMESGTNAWAMYRVLLPFFDRLVCYIGLSPRVFQSGDRCYYGRLGKWGNRWLRYGLGLLAQRAASSRVDNCLHKTYWRISLRKHRNSAKIAVARKATKIIYQMLARRQAWDDSKADMRTPVAA